MVEAKDPRPPVEELFGYPDTGQGLETIVLLGRMNEKTTYSIGKPIPQDLIAKGETYHLSDRAEATYTIRIK